MAFSYWWLHVAIDQRHQHLVAAQFDAARTQAAADAQASAILARWRALPGLVFDDTADGKSAVPFASRFNWSFRNEAFTRLGTRLVQSKFPECDLTCDADNTLEFIIHRHCTPASVLHAALGPKQAARLPGYLGNMVLHHEQLAACRRVLSELVNDHTLPELRARASRYLTIAGEADAQQIDAILLALGRTLAAAERRQTGFLSIGMPEV